MVSAPQMRLWVGVHRSYSCMGYQAARQEKVGASPSSRLNKSLHFIRLGHHQSYNAKDFPVMEFFLSQTKPGLEGGLPDFLPCAYSHAP